MNKFPSFRSCAVVDASGPRGAAIALVTLVASVAGGCGPAEPPARVASEATRAPAGAPQTDDPIEAILGAWETDLEHNGQPGRFAIEFVRQDDGTIVALISMPALDVWSMPAWPVTLEGNEVRMGSAILTFDPELSRITGEMPADLVPVHRIPMELRRVEAIERPAQDRPVPPSRDPIWTFRTGGPIWAGVTYADGIVYAGSDDGRIYAIDANSGEESWRFASEGAIRARPALDGRFLLVHSDDGYLYRLDKKDGSVDWRVRLGPPLERIAYGAEGYRYDAYAPAAAVSDGSIYISHSEDRLLAIDASTGEDRWNFKAQDHIASTPLARDGRVYFGSFDGHVRALDAKTGALLWEHPTGAAVTSSAAWHQGKVIIGSRSYDLLALDAEDGSVAWNYYYWFSWVESTAVVEDGIVYVGSSDAQLLNAIDAGTGRPIWSFDTGGSAWAEPAVDDATVYIGAAGVAGYMVDHQGGFFAVDRKSGRGVWRFPSERAGKEPLWGFTSSPAAGDGMVFAAGLDGKLYAFSASQ